MHDLTIAARGNINQAVTYDLVRNLIEGVYKTFPTPAGAAIRRYLTTRARRLPEVQRDLLPLLIYDGLTEEGPTKAIPLAAGWTLAMAAGHMFDAVQDEGKVNWVNNAATALGAANIALAQLQTDVDTLADIVDAVGRATALAASAQQSELAEGDELSRNAYFTRIAGKAGTIIATGVWMGGRLATENEETLAMLKEFGFALGIAIQIADDCEDLVADLESRVYTLPVIEAMAKRDDPRMKKISKLLSENGMNRSRAEQVAALLGEMGAVASARRVADAYMTQANTIFEVIPRLATYFASDDGT
jgi:hypothetical protein